MRKPQIGDWVTVKKTELSEEDKHYYPGWNDEMHKLSGKCGRVVTINKRDSRTGYEIEFLVEKIQKWWYLTHWMEEVMTPEEAVQQTVQMIERLVGALAPRQGDREIDELMDEALGIVFKHSKETKREEGNG
jgi:hypothetical protein